MKHEYHELADIFPMMGAEEFADLCDDIEKNGLAEPVVLYEGKVLDGRNRHSACTALGIVPATVEYTGDDPLAYVISKNLKRRHLTTGQRADIADELANMPRGGHWNKKTNVEFSTLVSVDEAAECMNVGRDSVFQVRKVKEQGIPELVDRVRTGKIAVSEAAKVSNMPKEQQKAVVEKLASGEAKSFVDAKRLVNKENVKNAPELPTAKYRVIYADPPWSYGNKPPSYSGVADNHYQTMSIAELCEMQIAEMTEDNAVLFLWTTSPLLEETFEVITAWGFKYKTSFVWDKIKHNMGHYNSVRHEFLLVCTKGSCTPDNVKLFDSVQSIERSDKHSEKPEEFRQIIDTLYPHGKRIELFARKTTENWDVFGNEV
jgi:N6-adenosine-specific RNA methylase IME4